MTANHNPVIAQIPNSQGTYALILRLDAARVVEVGRLGVFDFPAGYYLYIGSAFGPGGLAGRLRRHLAPDGPAKATHWHIDYLRRWAPVVAVWYGRPERSREHEWAAQAAGLPGGHCPAPRFGASDCRCHSHLFHFAQPPAAERFSALLKDAYPGDEPLQIIQIGRQNNLE